MSASVDSLHGAGAPDPSDDGTATDRFRAPVIDDATERFRSPTAPEADADDDAPDAATTETALAGSASAEDPTTAGAGAGPAAGGATTTSDAGTTAGAGATPDDAPVAVLVVPTTTAPRCRHTCASHSPSPPATVCMRTRSPGRTSYASDANVSAVRPCTRLAAPTRGGTVGGRGMTKGQSATVYSASVPSARQYCERL